MLRLIVAAMATVAVFALTTVVSAEDTKAIALKGSITCAKCDLGVAKTCMTVIKADDKVYYFDTAAHKKYHKAICQAAMEGEVTGVVKKDGDKMIITIQKLAYAK